ncbi:uncharacterized protein LOC128547802 [Mercenaria mercenaria]|uniref:uncharacterized protein LOC128547802 n=1 Tax=Mercenaria mercenaria TaxID=6596 RepID=UPI00234EA225|nr:uncharacterized protein LOC128547802 [Mercenaria mercenaria]XP_053376985.1 uncharacterized protein LOC128547802 [Mercenaria mercenaria]XP_053376988.1 uncharacterized protein LOC128547802 [Mercenaria mercenaria]
MDLLEEKDGLSKIAESCLEENTLVVNPDHDFTTKSWKEDFCFIVEEKRLYVAKVVLALASPVFERLFQADFKEKDETEIELPGKKFEDVSEFLNCIYPSVMKAVTIKNAYQIVALAEEYQVVALKAKCEACFKSSINTTTTAEVLYRLIDLACLYSLDKLFHKCTTLAADKSLADLDEAENQTPIPPKAKSVIQREIINKMEATQGETNQKIDNLKTELQRMTALYNCHRIGTTKKERLSLNDYQNWSGASVFSKIDTNKYRPYLSRTTHVCMLKICGTQITLEFKFANGQFLLEISVPETDVKSSKIEFVGKVAVVNGLKGKEDFWKILSTELYKYAKSRNVTILKEDTVLGEEGYMYHGEIGVEVHLLVLKTDTK